MDNNVYGPVLPSSIKSTDEKSSHEIIGPAIPRLFQEEKKQKKDYDDNIYGPVLPSKSATEECIKTDIEPSILLSSKKEIKLQEEDDIEICGPVIPSNANPVDNKSIEKIIGPALPSSLRQEDKLEELTNDDYFGPALPPHLLKRKREEEDEEKVETRLHSHEKTSDEDDDDDDSMVGPLPADCGNNSYTQRKLEERAWKLKTEFLKKDTPIEKKREEWMMELPPAHSAASFGLAPRKFRMREGPDMSDRSCWTDTPADRERKRLERINKASYEKPRKEKKKDKEESRDRKEKKSKKKEKSLLELHQEKLMEKRKKEEKEAKESGRILRRPFDRDIDLKIGGMSEKDKRSVFQKSKLLDDRFCHGRM